MVSLFHVVQGFVEGLLSLGCQPLASKNSTELTSWRHPTPPWVSRLRLGSAPGSLASVALVPLWSSHLPSREKKVLIFRSTPLAWCWSQALSLLQKHLSQSIWTSHKAIWQEHLGQGWWLIPFLIHRKSSLAATHYYDCSLRLLVLMNSWVWNWITQLRLGLQNEL